MPALSTGPTLRAYPLLFIVRKPGLAVERHEILALPSERVAKWWVPDDVVFLDTLPVGARARCRRSVCASCTGVL